MSASELKYREDRNGSDERRKSPSFARTVAASVAASLAVGCITQIIVFVSMFSRMQITMEHQDKQIEFLDKEVRENLKDINKINIELAKQTQILSDIKTRLSER